MVIQTELEFVYDIIVDKYGEKESEMISDEACRRFDMQEFHKSEAEFREIERKMIIARTVLNAKINGNFWWWWQMK